MHAVATTAAVFAVENEIATKVPKTEPHIILPRQKHLVAHTNRLFLFDF
jgi:hypothetical protein